MRDPYLYPGLNVLMNRLEVQGAELFEQVEAGYTSTRLKELASSPLAGDYSLDHLCQYHYYIFQDIFLWAGQLRLINIEKPEPVLGGLSVEYADFSRIKLEADSALAKLRSVVWADLSLAERAAVFSRRLAEIWQVHPFREGNTRTIVTFVCHFAADQGLPLDSVLLAHHSEYVRTALVAACANLKAIGNKSNHAYLIRIISDAMTRAL